MPAGFDRQVYFGEPITNDGSREVRVTGVSGRGTNVASVSFGWDTEGAARGELLGTFAIPPGADGSGFEDAVMARLVAADAAAIDSGVTANLIFTVEPHDADADATVNRIDIRYTSNGQRYHEEVLVDYTLRPGNAKC